jgi:hypothetical protein
MIGICAHLRGKIGNMGFLSRTPNMDLCYSVRTQVQRGSLHLVVKVFGQHDNSFQAANFDVISEVMKMNLKIPRYGFCAE